MCNWIVTRQQIKNPSIAQRAPIVWHLDSAKSFQQDTTDSFKSFCSMQTGQKNEVLFLPVQPKEKEKQVEKYHKNARHTDF